MKTTKEKADLMIQTAKEYIGKVYSNEIEYDVLKIDEKDLIHTAILSVKHTIDYLKLISRSFIIDPNKKYAFDVIAFSIYEQEQLLTELESRL